MVFLLIEVIDNEYDNNFYRHVYRHFLQKSGLFHGVFVDRIFCPSAYS